MDRIAVSAVFGQTHGLCSALVSAEYHEQVLMLAETFLPHLPRRVSVFPVAYFPHHASLGGVVVILFRDGSFPRSQVPVRGDDGPAVCV